MKSLHKVLDIIDTVADLGSVGIRDLSIKTGFPPATTHRIVSTLVKRRYLKQDPVSKSYSLSLRFLELGTKVQQQFNLVSLVRPHLERLMAETKESANLAVQDGDEVVYLDHVRSTHSMLQSFTRLGARVPLYTTGVGKMFLSQWPAEDVDHYLSRTKRPSHTSHTLSESTDLRDELRRIRELGYAIDNEEMEEGVRCVAALIFDHSGHAAAAISISGAVLRIPMSRIDELGEIITSYAQGHIRTTWLFSEKQIIHDKIKEIEMPKMKAMDAAVRILQSEGVKHIFGIPGAGILPFYRSLKDLGTIGHLVCRHEEGAIHMADGYARAINTVGVCAATSGPGASNFVTGLYTAQVDSIPILALTGQNVRSQLGREAFQAVDIAEIVKPVTKKSYCIKEPAMVPWVFREAFKIMKEGRPGPVLIDLPLDVQNGEIEYDPEADAPLPILRMPPNDKAVAKALDMLLNAEKPILLLGGGVVLADACEEFVALAEKLHIPVVSTYMGKSGIPWDHPLMAGHVGIQCNTRSGNQTFLESTVVLAVGARFNDRHTGAMDVYKGQRQFIHVDVDPAQLGKNVMPTLGICADAKLTLQAILKEIDRRSLSGKSSDWSTKDPGNQKRAGT